MPKVWDWFEESAHRHGREADRGDWRVMLYFHIADTREEALSEIRYGLKSFSGLGLIGATKQELDDPDLVDKLIERGRILVGTPDDAIETIEHLLEVSGGFGGFVAALYGLASPQNVLKSYDLMGRYVMPHFQGHFETVRQNREWVLATRGGPNGADTTGTPDGYYTRPVVRSRNGSS